MPTTVANSTTALLQAYRLLEPVWITMSVLAALDIAQMDNNVTGAIIGPTTEVTFVLPCSPGRLVIDL
jgi:hypothetical protein